MSKKILILGMIILISYGHLQASSVEVSQNPEQTITVVTHDRERFRIELSIARLLGLTKNSGERRTRNLVVNLEHSEKEEFQVLLEFIRSRSLSRSSEEYKAIIRKCMDVSPIDSILLLRHLDVDEGIKKELLKLIGKTVTELDISNGLKLFVTCFIPGIGLLYFYGFVAALVPLLVSAVLLCHLFRSFDRYKCSDQCSIGQTIEKIFDIPLAKIAWSPKMLLAIGAEGHFIRKSGMKGSYDAINDEATAELVSEALAGVIICNQSLVDYFIRQPAEASVSNKEAYSRLRAWTSSELVENLKKYLLKIQRQEAVKNELKR